MRALALFSGGLDSLLSMHLVASQGVEVIALHFNIGFGGNKDKREYLKKASAQVGAKLLLCDIQEQFFNHVLFQPQYGYGKYFNPCIDCHANMFRQAFYKLLELKADFVISGEVLGQRPKSQRREAMDQVKKLVRGFGVESCFDGLLDRRGDDHSKPKTLDELLLRPMSAQLLEPSFAEKQGWVDRAKLLSVQGRGRSMQLEKVKELGLEHYENPSGGCLLTDLGVSRKLKDLQAHRQRTQQEMVVQDNVLVKVGRYMVVGNTRVIVARNELENAKLEAPHPLMEKIELLDCKGPLGLVEKSASREEKKLAAQIVLSYAKSESGRDYGVQVGDEAFSLSPLEREKAQSYLFLT
ncbi:tRNA (5-methylaminomethyl-2-thiouridylate)-methyltransferase [Helicobacter sp. NHP19-012]|uniref:tRNA (5-methylaminomethyl-2-thiouridylate)-methyltransferase n=1 Tax=Helicobacter gastrofelis TaxID=2849642 RepID=A0ABM7SQB6_9HELI|nr:MULTISPECIES: 7-cyano-7-deazaguanine synthase [unclassified Helicobacter]BCZ19850.1 tRNA (5-methylaminomethyl-2-thiouridylate)-methyltransferase [Helicobacter sp. NHP19-012]GMB95522.1 tRNA (5-methylaminomethyl-2-thiouridylate)-methyltransferase [Helicobacter sp. NHP22-001]